MRFCVVNKARWNLRGLFGRKSKVEASAGVEAEKFYFDEDEDSTVKQFSVSISPDATEGDVLRARGFLDHNKSYKPPPDLETKLADIIHSFWSVDPQTSSNRRELTTAPLDWRKINFSEKINVKFQLLAECERIFGKRVKNSSLHEIVTGMDLFQYFATSFSLTAPYNQLARGQNFTEKPRNLHIIEDCTRYDAARDGPTAFPKNQGKSSDLRSKRIYQPIKCPSEWHEFLDTARADPGLPTAAPWSPDVASRQDSIKLRRPKFMP